MKKEDRKSGPLVVVVQSSTFYHERGREAMSNEDLVAKIQAGEREHMGTLWGQIERLVSQQAGRLARKSSAVEQEDLYQSGYLALVAAVESYDPDRGMKFIGWLAQHLKGAFAEVGGWRSKKRDPLAAAVSLDAPLGEDGGTLEDIVPDPLDAFEEVEDRIWREQLHAALDKALSGLTEAQEGTIRRRYYQSMSLEATGADMGVSAAEARKQEGQALRVLRHPRFTRELRAYIEERTPYFMHVGVAGFNTTGTSAVEALVLRRETLGKTCGYTNA